MKAFAGVGSGANGALLERLANPVARSGQFAHRALDVPPPQAVPVPVSERGEVALDGGPSDPGDRSGLVACQARGQQPEDQHLLADPWVGMGGPLLMNDPLLLFGQLHAKPSQGAPLCIPATVGIISLAVYHTDRSQSSETENASFSPAQGTSFPGLSCNVVGQFLEQGQSTDKTSWIRSFRKFVREHMAARR
jgi:hypothetical protein